MHKKYTSQVFHDQLKVNFVSSLDGQQAVCQTSIKHQENFFFFKYSTDTSTPPKARANTEQ